MENNNELYHWGLKLGATKEKHKYYQRINLGSTSKPKYRYFYTKNEYDAYMRTKQKYTDTKNTLSNFFNEIRSKTNQSNLLKNRTTNYKFTKDSFTNLFNTSKKKTSDSVTAVKTQTEKTAKQISKQIAKEVEKTKNAVTKIAEKGRSFTAKKSLNVKISSMEDDFAKATNDLSNSEYDYERSREKYEQKVKSLGKELEQYKKKVYSDKNKFLKRTEGLYNVEKTFKKMFKIESELLIESMRRNAVETSADKVKKRQEVLQRELDKSDAKGDYFNEASNIEKARKIFSDISREYANYLSTILRVKKSNDIKSFSDLKKKKTNSTPEEDMDEINPFYEQNSFDWSNNCSMCTAAYELRRRGYDVQANSASKFDEDGNSVRRLQPTAIQIAAYYGYSSDNHNYVKTGKKDFFGFERQLSLSEIESMHDGKKELPKWLSRSELNALYKEKVMKNAYYTLYSESHFGENVTTNMKNGGINHSDGTKNSISNSDIQSIKRAMLDEGNGARGNINVHWKNSDSGHSVVWEVVNGDVVIRDCQTNDTYPLESILERSAYCEYFRTDDKELSTEILKVVRNKSNRFKNDKHDNWD